MQNKMNLSIKTKMILVILVSITLLGTTVYFISSTVLSESYTNIEDEALLRDLDRANDAIENIIPQITVKLRDWAVWDDTYTFISELNSEYIDSNLGANNLANLEINAMIFADAMGNIVFRRVIDSNGLEVDSSDVERFLELHNDVLIHADFESSITGILQFPSGPFMFSSLPILTSEGLGPIHGSLTFGNYLNKDTIDEIADLTHLNIQIFPYGSLASPSDVKTAEKSLTTENNKFVAPLSETSIAAYKILYDYYGEPLLILKVESARDVYSQGKFAFKFFLLTTIALAIVFTIILILLLEHFIMSRFIELEKTVQMIGEKNDLTIRIDEGRKDEIGKLSASINGMLDKIVIAEKAEAESNGKMRTMSMELQKRLEETEKMNKIMVDRELRMIELKKEVAELKKGSGN